MRNTAAFGTARHPFRATLPLRVLRRLPQPEPEVRARMAAAAAAVEAGDNAPSNHAGSGKRPLVTVQDVKDFALAYCAFFMAASAFLS